MSILLESCHHGLAIRLSATSLLLAVLRQLACTGQKVRVVETKLLKEKELFDGVAKEPSIAPINAMLVFGFDRLMHQFDKVRKRRHLLAFHKVTSFWPAISRALISNTLTSGEFGNLPHNISLILGADFVVIHQEFTELVQVVLIHVVFGQNLLFFF